MALLQVHARALVGPDVTVMRVLVSHVNTKRAMITRRVLTKTFHLKAFMQRFQRARVLNGGRVQQVQRHL